MRIERAQDEYETWIAAERVHAAACDARWLAVTAHEDATAARDLAWEALTKKLRLFARDEITEAEKVVA